ncbi:MAG: EAL domain-containing protein [Longimicrobiales bacterium]
MLEVVSNPAVRTTPSVSAGTILRTVESREALSRATRLATMALRAPVAFLGLVENDGLALLSQSGLPEPWRASGRLPLDASFARLVKHSRSAVVIDNVTTSPLTRDLSPLENYTCRAFLGLGVRVSDEQIGILAVTDTQSRRWSTSDVSLLSDIAATVARDLDIIAGIGEAAARPNLTLVTDRSEQDSRYRALFEDNASAIFMLGSDGAIVEVNRATLHMFGLTLDDARTLQVSDIYQNAKERSRSRKLLQTTGAISELDVKLRRKDSTVIDCVVSATAKRSPVGEVTGYHGTIRDVTDQKRAQQKIVESAFQDPLTHLPNRAVFADRLERLLKHSKRRAGYRFAVLFIDLDRFKQVNDTYGHHAGDTLLTMVARRLEKCVRQEDTVARIGGDEFAVLLDAVSDVGGVTFVAQRILDELHQPVPVDGVDVMTGASVGISLSMTGYDKPEDMVRDADAAMYRAKAEGRGAYAVFDTEMYTRARTQIEFESQLRDAMVGNQLALHYHPVVALEDGGVTGLEALVRWDHPERGILLPGEFMPLAEATGLIVEIGWWVLREACRQLRRWQLEFPKAAIKLTMSVNLSARQFVQPDLVQKIDSILEETGLSPSSLRLDLQEAVVMQNADLAAKLLTQLRDRGIHICLDDFGSGYSSLKDLSSLPISTLKIDGSFVRNMEGTGDGRAIVQTIIALGRSMAIEAIAEGVETPEQLALLRTLGTRFAQGFLFSLPLDSAAAQRLISENIK